ncbi:unnamed protein product [Withania somnifera]
MALSFIDIIFFLLILVTPLDLLLAKKCFPTKKYEVHDDDLGDHYPAINEDFNWSFCGSFSNRTLFFCHFWWNSKDKAFDVFNDDKYCVNDSIVVNTLNYCKWEVRLDGFYLELHNVTDGSYYMYHYLDWS